MQQSHYSGSLRLTPLCAVRPTLKAAARFAMPGKPVAIPASRGIRNATKDAGAPAMAKRLEFAILAGLMALPIVLWFARNLPV